MTTLMKASNQWASRPDDERFTSLTEMSRHFAYQRDHSRSAVVPSKVITAVPDEKDEMKGLLVHGANGIPYAPNHWSFGQLASLAESPASYLRTLPAPIAADAINYKLRFSRAVEDVGLLLFKENGEGQLRAATGPNYGRVWNHDVIDALVKKFGDGVNGDWRVPGEFGKRVAITKANTTLYAGDRDMFVFLADEENRVVVPNRRNGQQGSLARGFFCWNSEVGKTTLGIGTFLFDYVCCNRIVWGAEAYREIKIRHTVSAPLRWMDEAYPVLHAYANSSAQPVEDAIIAAQAKKVDDVNEFLATRFGKNTVSMIKKVHELEENRPIETLWDVTTAVTAYARGINHIDKRVEMEREAGKVMQLAA